MLRTTIMQTTELHLDTSKASQFSFTEYPPIIIFRGLKKQILQQKRLQDGEYQSGETENGENGTLLYVKRAKTRKIACHYQASKRTKHSRKVEVGLDKWENREGVALNLPKPTKKTLKIHRGLGKAASTITVQMKTEKNWPQKFLQSRKMPGFDSPVWPCRRGLQSAKHLLIECCLHTRERNRVWEEDRRKVLFGRIAWEEILINHKFAMKAAQFLKSLGLIDKFRSTIIE